MLFIFSTPTSPSAVFRWVQENPDIHMREPLRTPCVSVPVLSFLIACWRSFHVCVISRQTFVTVNSEQEINISHKDRCNILQVRYTTVAERLLES